MRAWTPFGAQPSWIHVFGWLVACRACRGFIACPLRQCDCSVALWPAALAGAGFDALALSLCRMLPLLSLCRQRCSDRCCR
eukprot:13151562-Alexandrium_andersonii.AAC.1